jgi:hypothetical protein
MDETDREYTEDYTTEPNEYPYPGKKYMHSGEAVCEDCLVGMGVLPDHPDEHHGRVIADFYLCYVRPF